MKVRDIINKVEKYQIPELSTETQIDYINRLESTIYNDVIKTHEHHHVIPHEKGIDSELYAPDRFCDMYVYWILGQTDLFNGDIKRYSNDMVLYQQNFQEYMNWYNRTHTPIQHRIRY